MIPDSQMIIQSSNLVSKIDTAEKLLLNGTDRTFISLMLALLGSLSSWIAAVQHCCSTGYGSDTLRPKEMKQVFSLQDKSAS